METRIIVCQMYQTPDDSLLLLTLAVALAALGLAVDAALGLGSFAALAGVSVALGMTGWILREEARRWAS